MHGVAIELEVEELLGRWDHVRALQDRAESAVEENLATPCVRNPRSLLVCAVANELQGEADSARRLEAHARELWMDRRRVEEEAPRHTMRPSYLEPFALRALGRVREDQKLLERPRERFEAMHLEWHAAETAASL